MILIKTAIRQQVVKTLDSRNISLENEVVNKLFKKGTKGNKSYRLTPEELEQRKEDVVEALGGEGDTFTTCVRTLVDLMKEEGDSITEIAFRYYVVWNTLLVILF